MDFGKLAGDSKSHKVGRQVYSKRTAAACLPALGSER